MCRGRALRGREPALPSASFPDAAACPGSLDCALKRRSRCPPGAHACGPCLQPFQEDQQGLCVPRMRRPPGGGRPQPRLEDEIDFLAQELARKESGHSTPPLPKARQRLPEPGETPDSPAPWPCPEPSALALTCPLLQPPWASQHGDKDWSWASPPLQEPPCPRPTPPWAPLCHPSRCTCRPWSPGEGTATASPSVGLGRGWAGAAGPPAEAALTRPLLQC